MTDTPWWLAVDPPATMPIPYSGEVVPIDVPPVPVDVPIAGPVIHFIGEGEHAVWNDVWGWVKGTAKTAASDVVDLAEQAVHEAVKISEAYTGAVLQALSGFINDAFDYAQVLYQGAISFGVEFGAELYADFHTLAIDVYKILEDVVGIEGTIIPALAGEIERLGIDTWNLVGGVAHGLRVWAIDTIYDPLAAEIERVDTKIRDDVWNLTGAWVQELESLVHSEAATRAAAIAGIAAAVAAIATEITDCVEPMCQTLGPKTDLGKLLKGLSLAVDAAAIADLLSLTEPQLAQRLAEVIGEFGRFVGDIENNFLTGGRTLGATIAGLA